MIIFILSVVLVSIISLCFFKKRFWENRYMVLLISAGVALVATLATNYATRDELGTTVVTVWEKPIVVMKLNDSLLHENYSFASDEELDYDDVVVSNDSTTSLRQSHYLVYYDDGDAKIRFSTEKKNKYRYLNDTYILPSQNDSTAYLAKVRHDYQRQNIKWVADFSLPYIKDYAVLYIPPSEYAAIPDSLIREFPIKI